VAPNKDARIQLDFGAREAKLFRIPPPASCKFNCASATAKIEVEQNANARRTQNTRKADVEK